MRGDLDDFITCYRNRTETKRFRRFSYEELINRDKLNLDIFWLKDHSRQDLDGLPSPELIAIEVVENLSTALDHFRSVTNQLRN